MLLTLSLFVFGCATYQTKVTKARHLLSDNNAKAAIEFLQPLAEDPSDDQLVYVFDYATALQAAGDFKQSNEWFQKADKLSDLQDYISLTRQAGSLLLSQELVQYKGEDFERLFINVMSAINYLMLGDLEAANVETRRLNEKLNYYRIEEKKPYEQNSFAFYLNAHIWEANRNWDSAYIDFKKAYELNPEFEYIKEDLVRSAYNARRMDEYAKWSKQFKIEKKPEWNNRKYGELIVVYLQGWGPRKKPNPSAPRFPMLDPMWNLTTSARLRVYKNEKQVENKNPRFTEVSQSVYDVESVAIKTLNDQYAGLIAKRIAGYVVKEVAANEVAKQNEALGAIVRFALHASDRADLRQWSTLPQTIQVARIYLPVGRYIIDLEGLNDKGVWTGEGSSPIPVEIRPNRKTFQLWRSWR